MMGFVVVKKNSFALAHNHKIRFSRIKCGNQIAKRFSTKSKLDRRMREFCKASADKMCRVDNIHGCRISQTDRAGFRLEFLSSFKDSSEYVWMPVENIAEDVRANFNKQWWSLCREERESANFSTLIQGSGEVLVKARDVKSRSPLHYACGVGNLAAVKRILESQAEVDAQDCEGYTPLHIAAGYLNAETAETLLKAGANPEEEDDSGRSALNLVETLKAATPASTINYRKRADLESLSTLLRSHTFEEVVPANIIDSRVLNTGVVEYLVEWMDGYKESWVNELDVSDDLILDHVNYVEFGSYKKTYETKKEINNLLVQWKDGVLSWEIKAIVQSGEI